MSEDLDTWRRCSICKREIAFRASYFSCSVSTCQRTRNPLYFCSLGCWEAHLPMMRHRDAWAEQQRAPTRAEWQAERAAHPALDEVSADDTPGDEPLAVEAFGAQSGITSTLAGLARSGHGPAAPPAAAQSAEPPRRRIIDEVARATAAGGVEVREAEDPELAREVLVVVSKLKAYVKARSGMNTSDGVVGVLSDHLRRLCVEAIRNAARDGRRTVMDRDFAPLV